LTKNALFAYSARSSSSWFHPSTAVAAFYSFFGEPMTEIIQFPVQDEKNWAKVENLIRGEMEIAKAPEPVIDEVLFWLKDIWFKHGEQPIRYQITVPEVCIETMNEVVNAVIDQMSEMLYRLMMEAAGQKTRLEMLKYEHNL